MIKNNKKTSIVIITIEFARLYSKSIVIITVEFARIYSKILLLNFFFIFATFAMLLRFH